MTATTQVTRTESERRRADRDARMGVKGDGGSASGGPILARTMNRARGRREFLRGWLALGGLGLLAGCGVPSTPAPPAAKIRRIGYLTINSRSDEPVGWLRAFREGLRELGYLENQNIAIDERWADGRNEQLPELAGDLVQQKVDVILTNSTPAAQAAQRATSAIPIVMATSADPVGLGIVASLARPGGNVTGLHAFAPELATKRLLLLQESVPGIARVGVLYPAQGTGRIRVLQETESAARILGVQVRPLGVRVGDDLAALLASAVGEGVDALIVLQGTPLREQQGATVANLVAQHRLPAMYDGEEFVEAGGLMFYGSNFPDSYRRAATYVDKILKGGKPADLPIEQPITFDFVINLKAAGAIGLSIPRSVLQQATNLIQ